MKRLLFIGCILASTTLPAQKIEYSFQLQSGLFSFKGRDAVKISSMSVAPVTIYSTPFPEYYGKKPGFSYSIEATIKRRLRSEWLYGLGIAVESLENKMDVNEVRFTGFKQTASGSSSLQNQFINANPFFGKRIALKSLMMEFDAGLDVDFNILSREKGEATTITANHISTNFDRILSSRVDIRTRIQLTAWYKKIGLLLGYSSGLTNYYGHQNGRKAFSQFLRMGISYRLK